MAQLCQIDRNCPYPPVVTVNYQSSKKRCCAVHHHQLFLDPAAYAQVDPFADDKDEAETAGHYGSKVVPTRGDPGDSRSCRRCNDGPLRDTNKSGLCTECFNMYSTTRLHWRKRHGIELTIEDWIACGGRPSGQLAGPRHAFWKHSPTMGKWSVPA